MGIYVRKDECVSKDEYVYVQRLASSDMQHIEWGLQRPLCKPSPDILYMYSLLHLVSILDSQISINNQVVEVSFATFRRNETKEIEIGDWD